MPCAAVYITGHGFGHAMRAASVMGALHDACPDLQFHVRTPVSESLLRTAIPFPFVYKDVRVDTGAFEANVLETDAARTLEVLRAFHETAEDVAESEAAELVRQGVSFVLSDVPPLASEIAARAGVPSFAVANFTWDRIFAAMPGADSEVERIRGWYRSTTLGFEVPLGHRLDAFPRVERAGLIARISRADRREVRGELGLAPKERAVLVVLKGPELDGVTLAAPEGIRYLTFLDLAGDHVLRLEASWQRRFPDLVAAADVVLSKPGYGIVGECIANRTPMLHLPRRGFAETPYLVADMDRYLPHRPVEGADLGDARALEASIQELVEVPFPDSPPMDGAETIARRVLEESGLA